MEISHTNSKYKIGNERVNFFEPWYTQKQILAFGYIEDKSFSRVGWKTIQLNLDSLYSSRHQHCAIGTDRQRESGLSHSVTSRPRRSAVRGSMALKDAPLSTKALTVASLMIPA
jgi:hypothetical protein